MNVAIRVDASCIMGTGHVMRCLVLAKKLLQRGHDVCMISRPLEGNLIAYCQSQHISVKILPCIEEGLLKKNKNTYASWLGVSQETDAAQSVAALRSFSPDWLVFDHYALDKTWQHIMQVLNVKILAIDDLAERQHACDILLDTNPWENKNVRYINRIPSHALSLLGPKYALLRDMFAQLKQHPPLKKHNQLLVFFSGADPTGENLKLLKACQTFSTLPFEIKMVFGMANPMKTELLAASFPDFLTCVERLPDFEKELSASRYAFGSAGVSAIERSCLNIPATLVCIAQNQRLMAEQLAASGQCRYLGEAENTHTQTYIDELTWLCEHWETLPEMPKNSDIDGHGADRVIDVMEGKK